MRLRELKWLVQGHVAHKCKDRIQTHRSLMSDCAQPVYHNIPYHNPSQCLNREKSLLLAKNKLESSNSLSLSLSLRHVFRHKPTPKILILHAETSGNHLYSLRKEIVLIEDPFFFLPEKFKCICHLNCRQYIKEKFLLCVWRQLLSKKRKEISIYPGTISNCTAVRCFWSHENQIPSAIVVPLRKTHL